MTNISKRTLLKFAAFILLAPLANTATAQISAAVAVNRAGRFRALSQRCAKAYCQLQLEVMPDNAKDVLASAQRLIQISFDDLGKAGLAGESSGLLFTVQENANVLNGMLGALPTRNGVLSVSAQADKMLTNADLLTNAIEASTKQSSARLINIAGRQRMLSQRLAKNYFLTVVGDAPKLSRDQLTSDREEYKKNVATLSAAPVSTAAIRNELQLAQSQWVFFENALAKKPDMESLRNIATTSERLLEINNNLAIFYETALKDILGTT